MISEATKALSRVAAQPPPRGSGKREGESRRHFHHATSESDGDVRNGRGELTGLVDYFVDRSAGLLLNLLIFRLFMGVTGAA